MIIIKNFFKYENANAIEVTWVETKEENFIKKEIVEDNEVETIYTKTVETIIHCQSFSDSQIDLLRQTAKDFKTSLTQEHEEIIADVIANRILPTKEELEAIVIEKEKQRILSIKAEAGRIIEIKYPIYKQNNILMSQNIDDIQIMNDYILAIRNISNNAELDGTALENIDWGI